MPFEHYIQKGSRMLRLGFTTGTCAALAAKAAAETLLSGEAAGIVGLTTPKRLTVQVPVEETERGDCFVCCSVCKDAGDDPDITNGVLVYAKVSKTDRPGIEIDGGDGIGRVTRPGLDQPVGAAAINSVPRRMITDAVQSVCDSLFYEGGLSVVISIPEGARLAARTFNPKLGIEGGLSILGTSGIVEPMSTQALIDTIGLEFRALAAAGHRSVVLTPGNYGKQFLATHPFLEAAPTIKCSNYIGDALDFAVFCEFSRILLVGHLGKLVKLAGGIMNTHSSSADCRMEILTAHAALAGADRVTAAALMDAVSNDACVEILDRCGLREAVMSSLLSKIQEQLSRRVGDQAAIGAVIFSNQYGLLGRTETVAELIDFMKRG
jgi:cobalt-precorrin-5B (C1)-methyltransferase